MEEVQTINGEPEKASRKKFSLFTSFLSEEEVLKLITDQATNPMLFASAAKHVLVKIVEDYILPYEVLKQADLIVKHAAVFEPKVSETLVPFVEDMFYTNNHVLYTDAGDFFKRASLPISTYEEVLDRLLEDWTGLKIKVFLSALANKVNTDKENRKEYIRLIKKPYKHINMQAEGSKANVANYLANEIQNVLAELYPVLDEELFDIAIKHVKTWNKNALKALKLAGCYKETLFDRIINQNNTLLDSTVAENSNLTPSQRWRLYVRYAKDNPTFLGEIIYQMKLEKPNEFLDTLVSTGLNSALIGYIRRDKNDIETDYHKSILKIAAKTLSKETIKDSDGKLAASVYKYVGAKEAVSILKLRNSSVSMDLAKAWSEGYKDDALLEELMVYPLYQIREVVIQLLFSYSQYSGYNPSYNSINTDFLKSLKDEVKNLFANKILPKFVNDRAQSVRDGAKKLLPYFNKDVNTILASLETSKKSVILDTIDAERSKGNLSREFFDRVFKLGLTKSDSSKEDIITRLISNAPTEAYYIEKALDLNIELVNKACIEKIKSTPWICKDKIKALIKSQDYTTLIRLARLNNLDWSEYEKYIFINNNNENVAEAFIESYEEFNLKDILQILHSQNRRSVYALIRNNKYKSYLKIIEDNLKQ